MVKPYRQFVSALSEEGTLYPAFPLNELMPCNLSCMKMNDRLTGLLFYKMAEDKRGKNKTNTKRVTQIGDIL